MKYALAHGDESTGWKQFSIPMVNVRATLKLTSFHHAQRETQGERLSEAAKAIFYPQRTWRGIADACELRDFDLEDAKSISKRGRCAQLCYTFSPAFPHRRNQTGKSGMQKLGTGRFKPTMPNLPPREDPPSAWKSLPTRRSPAAGTERRLALEVLHGG